jgi:hypothetical protein
LRIAACFGPDAELTAEGFVLFRDTAGFLDLGGSADPRSIDDKQAADSRDGYAVNGKQAPRQRRRRPT